MKSIGIILVALLLIFSACDSPHISLIAVGDVMLDRGVLSEIKKKGVDYPFTKINNFLDADINLCNLEFVISDQGQPKSKKFTFRVTPNLAKGLENSGFNLFGLVNNHTMDYGEAALKDTINFIKGLGANYIGENHYYIFEKQGLKVGFIGVDFIGAVNIPEVEKNIETLKTKTDFIILSAHWGDEFFPLPTKKQIQLGHKFIDLGVDLVIGHHPHVIQPVEYYNGGYIFYSLGNFIFDQMNVEAREGLMLKADIGRSGIQHLSLIPIVIKNMRPNIAEGENFKRIDRKLQKMLSK